MPRLSTIAAVVALLVVAWPQLGSKDIVAQRWDVSGRPPQLFEPVGTANVLLFVSSDCPISNAFAPEIQRLCGRYRKQGVSCSLVYEDLEPDATRVHTHLSEYGYGDMPAVMDADRAIARRAGASVTPQAVVIDRTGAVRYRGRINNFYADFGKPRRHVTQHDLRDALEALLAGRPVARPETEALGCYIAAPRKHP